MDSYDNDGLLLAMDDDLFPVDDATEATECGSIIPLPNKTATCL